jgi:plastocyanin
VTWVNDDNVVHNVRQVESVFLSPEEMSRGESFSFTFDQPGTYRYQCTFHHPTMNGVVIVEGS